MPSDISGPPNVFISSVYREPGIPGSELHFHIRRRIRDMAAAAGIDAWIAEYKGLTGGTWTEIIDACVDNLIDSQFFIAVLGRRAGSPFDLGTEYGFALSSAFEIELFFASLNLKPSFFFVVRGYEPEPELENLVRILRLNEANSNWFVGTENEIDERIRELFSAIAQGRDIKAPLPNFCDLTSGYRSFRQVEQEIRSEKLSLIGRFSPVDAGDYAADRIGFLIDEARNAPNRTAQLSRLWLALRELSKRPFDPADTAAAEQWVKLSAQLPTISAWLGLHGPLNLGVMAAYQTQNELRRHGLLTGEQFPFGAFASESYSIGLNHGRRGWKRLRFTAAERLATRHADLHPADPSNALTIRGHARLRLAELGSPWQLWKGLADFRRVCAIREKRGAGSASIGEALFNLGLAEFHVSRVLRYRRRAALAMMRDGISHMETQITPGSVGHLVSAKRKLVTALENSRLLDEAKAQRESAVALAREYGILDQLRRL